MVGCIVPGCKSDSSKKKKISFHQFPCDEELRIKWLKAVSRQGDEKGSEWVPTQYSSVCGLHFSQESFQPNRKKRFLMKNAVPSIFPTYPTYKLNKETTPRRKIKKFALDIDNHPDVEITERAEEQSKDIQILGDVPSTQTPVKRKSRQKIKKFVSDVDNHPHVEKTKKAEKQSNDFQILGAVPSTQTPLQQKSRQKIKKFASDVDNRAVVERTEKAEEQSNDFQILGGVPSSQTLLEQKNSSDVNLGPHKKIFVKFLVIKENEKLRAIVERTKRAEEQSIDFKILRDAPSTQTPLQQQSRQKIEKFSSDIDNHPVVDRTKRAKEQSNDFQILGDVPSSQTSLEQKNSSVINLSPFKKRCLKLALDLHNQSIVERTKRAEKQSNDFKVLRDAPSTQTPLQQQSRQKIKKFASDVDNHPVVDRTERAEEQSDDFEILGDVPFNQTSQEQKYSSDVDLSPLNKRCLLLKKKLHSKTVLLGRTRKKLTASKEKYNSLLKSYNDLLNEHKSLNLDALKQMDANNIKRQFLLDQLSNLSKKKPKWSEQIIRTCIMWRSESPAGYQFARNIGFLKLPGRSTLNRYLKNGDGELEFSSVVESLESEKKSLENTDISGSLITDTMSTKLRLSYDELQDTLVGTFDVEAATDEIRAPLTQADSSNC